MMKHVEDRYRSMLLDPEYKKTGRVEYRTLFHKYILQVKRDGTKIFGSHHIKTINRKQYWVFIREYYYPDGSTTVKRGKYSMNL